jgi:hypothetical protein
MIGDVIFIENAGFKSFIGIDSLVKIQSVYLHTFHRPRTMHDPAGSFTFMIYPELFLTELAKSHKGRRGIKRVIVRNLYFLTPDMLSNQDS